MKKCIFIHIPKTGGQAVSWYLKKHNYIPDIGVNDNNQPYWCMHKTVSFYGPERRKNSFIFSFVRNPFDRLLSAYYYLAGGFGSAGDIEFGKTLPTTFKKFVKNMDDLQFSGFSGAGHFRPMLDWIDDDIDFIGRFENLQEDFNIICDKIGTPQSQLPHINASEHKHYTEYYDEETKEIVAKKYAKDIEQFGYKFV